jgi:hypothetical protein
MREPLGIIDLHVGNLTILKLNLTGQAARVGLLPGMQIKAIAHFPVRNKEEMDKVKTMCVHIYIYIHLLFFASS